MGVFDDVVLKWADKDYRIPANRMLGAIACLEAVITLQELGRYGPHGSVSMSKLSQAYGAILRYAGAGVPDEEIYGELYADPTRGTLIDATFRQVLEVMLPPAQRNRLAPTVFPEQAAPGNPPAAAEAS
jgi:hypothetical protein